MYAGTNKGGTEAIVAAERLVIERRNATGQKMTPEDMIEAFPLAIDRIMGEGGLWAPRKAAQAYLQANGDITEAVHLIRAHRSTLPRLMFTEPLNPREVQILRRVVSTQRQPDGPMVLGETVDYTARIIADAGEMPLPIVDELDMTSETRRDEPFLRFRDQLANMGVLVERHPDVAETQLGPDEDANDPEPFDIQLKAAELPATRSAWLSAIAQADTGALINIWYQSVLGPDGGLAEYVTLGEVRHGRIVVRIAHPHTGQPVELGRMRVSETEAVARLGDLEGEDPTSYDVGYAMALGHNERKAIAGASLDISAVRFRGTEEGKRLEQVLMHTTDGLAASGFLEHLKLPHYVTFQSGLDAAMAARMEQDTTEAQPTDHLATHQEGTAS